MNKAVFLDRDGVINVDKGYVHRIEDFKFIDGVIPALQRLSGSDFRLFVITDQSGIGRRYYTEKDMENVHSHMLRELSKKGIVIDRIYYCPHAPEDNCGCRKPSPLLLRNAKNDFGIDLKRSFFIGDKTKDIQAGKSAGCKAILVLTGKQGKDAEFKVEPDFVAKNLMEAVSYILEYDKKTKVKERN